jgi:hypothetical protein
MATPSPHGDVALMLCESLLHLLVEEGVLPKEKVLETIAGVAELTRERAERSKIADASGSALELIERIASSFAVKGRTPAA